MDTPSEQQQLTHPHYTWTPPSRPVAKEKKWACKGGGALRVVRLCILGVMLPGLLVAVPLYLKYHVYSQHLVPLAMSDMRMIDTKISTTWCQRQLVTSNATFNAYLLGKRPDVKKSEKFVKLQREMVLEDDMKEYWGFYLLKGSTVTVSSCARRHGGSLIVIRGHHHLRQCAYIGDDSSEEEEELQEIRQKNATKEKELSNRKRMEKVRPEVTFFNNRSVGEETIIRKQLDMGGKADDFDMALLEEHRAQIRTAARPQTKQPSQQSKEMFNAVINKLKSYRKQGKNALEEVDKLMDNDKDKEEKMEWIRQLMDKSSDDKAATDGGRARRHIRYMHSIREQFNADDDDSDHAEEEGVEHEEVRGSINGTTANDTSNSEFWSSFSSSEERLLECAGLIVSQPLTPSAMCHFSASTESKHAAASQHTITYTVPVNGYYFFVFSSENEIQENYLWTEFILEKMQYDVSNSVASCQNSTGECALPLHFFSEERLVLELPVDETLWNSEYLVISTCEPRTALYIACIVAVPVLILLFAL